MSRIPGMQSRVHMRQKEPVIRKLHEQGLTIAQISHQVRCSGTFVRRILREQVDREEEDEQVRESTTCIRAGQGDVAK